MPRLYLKRVSPIRQVLIAPDQDRVVRERWRKKSIRNNFVALPPPAPADNRIVESTPYRLRRCDAVAGAGQEVSGDELSDRCRTKSPPDLFKRGHRSTRLFLRQSPNTQFTRSVTRRRVSAVFAPYRNTEAEGPTADTRDTSQQSRDQPPSHFRAICTVLRIGREHPLLEHDPPDHRRQSRGKDREITPTGKRPHITGSQQKPA